MACCFITPATLALLAILSSVFATPTGSTLAATSPPVLTTTKPSPRDLLEGRQKPLIQATEGILNVKSNGFEVSYPLTIFSVPLIKLSRQAILHKC
jgi:hypothetical protein